MTMRRVWTRLLPLGFSLFLAACAASASQIGHPLRASDDFLVVMAGREDTAETLAAKHLNNPHQAWVIAEFRNGAAIRPGEVVVIPRKPRRLGGISAEGHQVVPILTYHDVVQESRSRFTVTADLFEQQLRYLKEHGYVGITTEDLMRFLQYEAPLPPKAVLITIDDGYKSVKTVAAPLLKRYGFPAVFFIYTDFIGGGANAMSWTDLRDLKADGFEIQAHSKTHNNLAIPTAREGEGDRQKNLESEILNPKQLIQQRLGADIRYFAYPYGGFTPEVVDRVKSAGYQAGFGAKSGSNPFFADRYRLKRYSVFMEKDLTHFIRKLETFIKD